MANVVKKEDKGQQSQRGELVRRDPFEVSRDPFRMFERDPFQLMREMMINPFRAMGLSPFYGRDVATWNPGFDIRETDDAFIFKADLAGVRSEDVDISLTGNQLCVSGKREHEQEKEEGQYHSYERSYGNFCRTFALPESADLDKIRSDLKDGELTLVVPKKPGSQPQRRKIQIGSGQKS
jgi:HSP20 family protein